MPRELSEFERLPRFLICQRHRPPPCTRCRNPVNPGANIYFKKRVEKLIFRKKDSRRSGSWSTTYMLLWNNRKKEKLNCPSPGGEILDRNLSSSRILQSASITFFFSFLTWQTIITGNETRTQHLQNITILTLALEFKWGSTKMCFFSLAILCRFWEMWERGLTRELPQGELHFSHCIFWCSCKKRRTIFYLKEVFQEF